jgi:hypothetical protein
VAPRRLLECHGSFRRARRRTRSAPRVRGTLRDCATAVERRPPLSWAMS